MPNMLKYNNNIDNFEIVNYMITFTHNLIFFTDKKLSDRKKNAYIASDHILTISSYSEFAQSAAETLIKILSNSKQTLKV